MNNINVLAITEQLSNRIDSTSGYVSLIFIICMILMGVLMLLKKIEKNKKKK